MTPNFSAYPFERLRRLSRRDAALESTVARWIAARSRGERLAKLVGGPVRASVVAPSRFDPYAARCEVRVAGAAIEVRGASAAVRAITQRLLGGPDELAAPRPLAMVERAIWALVVATALEDLGSAGEVWPLFDVAREGDAADIVELACELGGIPLAAQLVAPPGLELRVPPSRPLAVGWTLDLPVIVGRCALARSALGGVALRSVITLDRPAATVELELFGGVVGLRVAPQAVVGEVVTGYVRRDMSLPDDAHMELTVTLGTTQLSLRQVCDLAIGQIVSLGRPLAGPFELHAAGRLVGRGELVDVDGELAVRIVSLGD